MTKLEDLPNEVFYEIFDYLDISHAFEAFFYQNTRLKSLLIHSPLLFQIDLSNLSKCRFEDCCRYIIEENLNRILSLRFNNPLTMDFFLSLLSFKNSFTQLESIIFSQINFSKLESILFDLSFLPRLYSLTINNNIEIDDSSRIYRLIFNLPVLKSCIISPKFYGGSLLLNPVINGTSSIEYLSITRHCSLNQFLTFLSYTPKLRRLSNLSLSETTNITTHQFSTHSPQLSHLSLKLWRMSFENLKYLSSKLFYHLEVLNICTRADDYYLIAERWEQLILNHMPHLRRFDFQHYWEPVDNDEIEQRTYHTLIDRFTSPFWIDRQWFFAHQHFPRRGIRDAVFYSTHPYRRNLYELHERAHNDDCPRRDRGENFARRVNIDDYRAATNRSLHFPYATDLSLWGKGARGNFSFIADLRHMFQFSQLTHFSVQCPDFGLAQLIEVLNHLPNVHSLILYTKTSYLSGEQISNVDFLGKKNRIVNVTIRGRCQIQQIQLLMNLCPRVKSLEIEIEEDQLKLILRYLLLNKTINNVQMDSSKTKFDGWQRKFFDLFSRTQTKKISSSDELNQSMISNDNELFSICFFNPQPGMEFKLQRLIIKEKLLNDYSIQSVLNYLYLWW